jgi:hypothetical protein
MPGGRAWLRGAARLRAGHFRIIARTYEPVAPRDIAFREFAQGLARLHVGLRQIVCPRRTSRIVPRRRKIIVTALSGTGRTTGSCSATVARSSRAIGDRAAAEQLLHGEPHPGNVLKTKDGLLFIDFETCCRGPVGSISSMPREVGEYYPGETCRANTGFDARDDRNVALIATTSLNGSTGHGWSTRCEQR